MRIGLVGKPNVGKSTYFSAATLAKVDIANYPFCTIEANVGVAFIAAPMPCPCKDLRKRLEADGRLEPVSDDTLGRAVFASQELAVVLAMYALFQPSWSM